MNARDAKSYVCNKTLDSRRIFYKFPAIFHRVSEDLHRLRPLYKHDKENMKGVSWPSAAHEGISEPMFIEANTSQCIYL